MEYSEQQTPEEQTPEEQTPEEQTREAKTHREPREMREQHEHKPPREQRAPSEENTIFVGKKNVMAYVLAVVTRFNSGANEVKIKARGKAISRAVDVSQIVKNRFISSMRISDFNVETEEVQNEDGSTSRVSSLTLTLVK